MPQRKSTNAKQLTKILKKDGPLARALRKEIPPSTLRDHAAGKRAPSSIKLLCLYVWAGLEVVDWESLSKKELGRRVDAELRIGRARHGEPEAATEKEPRP